MRKTENAEKDIILSIDQSTSGTKALLFGAKGELLARKDKAHRQITNALGWVEHDPEEIYRNTISLVRDILAETGTAPERVLAVGISNQRETGAAWDETGRPVCNAVVWQCARGAAICRELEEKGRAAAVKEKTGLNLSPYFTAAKFAWILRNADGAKQLAEQGRLRFGTMDSFLLYRLTGEHKTDYSNASRTQLFNIHTLRWDKELCGWFGVPEQTLPQVCDSDSVFGRTDMEGIFPSPVPVCGVLGDSHAALFAQGCVRPGMAKVTYGTGSSVMMNTGTHCAVSERLVSSLAWSMGGTVNYVLEGNINYSGAVIDWLVRDLELIASPKEVSRIAAQVPSAQGVYLVPAFSGLGAPHWCSEARAVLCGMGRRTRRAHVVRAAEESIAYQVRDIAGAMDESGEQRLRELRADGGPTADRLLMQFQADILNVPLSVSGLEELSGAGAAYMAGISAGIYRQKELYARRKAVLYRPEMDARERETRYDGWKKAVDLVLYGAGRNLERTPAGADQNRSVR